jgi:hypothetical protein
VTEFSGKWSVVTGARCLCVGLQWVGLQFVGGFAGEFGVLVFVEYVGIG